MIREKDGLFQLSTNNSSYWFRATEYEHLEHIYYGRLLPKDQDPEVLAFKRTAQLGSSVVYNSADETYCLDAIPLEYSGVGKGDFRDTPTEIKMPDGSFNTDFLYENFRIVNGAAPATQLPSAYSEREDDCQTLELTLRDAGNSVILLLYYTVFEKANVITRRAVLANNAKEPLTIRRMMSLMLDMPNRDFSLVTFDGGWIKEANRHDRKLSYGIHVNSSTTGASSNRHNPGFLLAAGDASESAGEVYGFNLVYSGNHYGAVELANHDLVRVNLGINPFCFEWELVPGERFETPEAVMGYSQDGFNGLSKNFHDFVNNNIIGGEWKGKERPVLFNNWEANFFKFTRGKLLRLARRAKKLGIELFVLDDGWFKGRNSDRAGLGDYEVNQKKLPRGLPEFAGKIRSLDMKFGLWFEPEMVNPNSDLYRAHPEYAVKTPNKDPALGRNQLVLDLANPAVRDYIVENVTRVIDSCGVEYVKWDMNRHISDAFSPALKNQGEFYHRYILGLYEILERIFKPRPHILFESCSSGGNRFDLGMLCYSPQVWSSDNTDPIERLKIQGGLSYLYPLSAMGAHVSEAPHQQTLRDTPLPTRFNVASFGCLGYELDLKYLSRAQMREIKNQIEYYKRHRRTLQYGRFYRGERYKRNKVVWHCVNEKSGEAITGFFQTQTTASEGYDRLAVMGIDPAKKYVLETRPQSVFIKRFGGLVKHIMPLALDPEGFILRTANKYYALTDCVERYESYGAALIDGIPLNNQFVGSYYNEHIRLLGDFGSNLYLTRPIDTANEGEAANE